jgi:peptidoglycan/xylan/chitin deacetylase (PgdA/CDA1 family)
MGARLARAAALRWSRALPVDPPGWDALAAELDHWTGRPATVWWRDDDAVAATAPLHRLLDLRARLGVPLALAVVPARVEPGLAAALPARGVDVLVHGWDHANHAGPGAPMAEFPAGRDPAEVRAQLRRGLTRLGELFGARLLPVLVPPFSQLAPSLADSVRGAGFGHVSLDRDFTGIGLRCVNVHADVIDWPAGTAAAPVTVVRALISALRLRRLGLVARDAPVGVMTHHLVHDAAIWTLTETTLTRLAAHPGARFAPIPQIFAGTRA